MTEYTDEKVLLSEIKQNNKEAFEFLFKRYYPRLQGYAIRFVEDEEVARDIIQECFLKFWEKRELLSAVSVTSLLFAMVRNSCLNYLKHLSVIEKHQIEYLANQEGEERLYYADFALDAEYGLLYDELQEQIKIVINGLPERCREVFVMSRFKNLKNREIADKLKFKNLKNREIADKLKISTTAVEKQIAKALGSFSKHFKDKYPLDIYIMVLAWAIFNE